jgi:alkylation response protein AidB-like acyl-CoA dehydrogenase
MRGAEWLIVDTDPSCVFTPEKLNDDQRLIHRTATEFLEHEVLPAIDALEKKDWALVRSLIKRCGELGLIGTDVPEEYGGVGLDKAAAVIVSDALGAGSSFATTFGATANLSIVPLLWFGTDAQKAAYLPRLCSGDWLGAYCLSESGSGSDALAARTRAVRQPDGSWRLDGEKMWTTNGGFADLFIVFAKVDGDEFSAFIVERGFPGVSSGAEEHKMGLHGSSTTPVILQDAKVPAANLLGEIGKGHKIAFNVLNYGRLKLAANCTGGAKLAISEAARYAATRRQFGQPLGAFGAIRHKLAEMTVRQYGVESMLYRTVGDIDAARVTGGGDVPAFEEFAVEAALLKVAGSEMLDYVLDENVQIHGGNGFVRDYPAERHYRDARVNRIFEGTNEINRLLVPGLLVKRALKGGVPVLKAAKRLQDELLNPPAATTSRAETLTERTNRNAVALKKTALMVLGLAAQTYGEGLTHEQEILMIVSDLVREAFAADSARLRAAAAGDRPLHAEAAAVLAHDACLRAEAHARTALSAMTNGDTLTTMLAALRRILKVAPVNTIEARRRIAQAVLDKGGYVFG